MFRLILPGSFYVDTHGSLIKILRTTSTTVHYQRNGHNYIARYEHTHSLLTL